LMAIGGAVLTLGLVQRRRLGPPVGSWVYELTDWGKRLEPVLVHLGQWGRHSPFRDLDAGISVDSLLLAMRGDFAPTTPLTGTYALHFGDDHVSVRVVNGEIEVDRGEPADPDVTISTDTRTFAAVLVRKRTLDDAISAGDLVVTGEKKPVEQLLNAFPRPQSGKP
ncbi:alkyl sulfatase C-terminal domain-containing protein, partial [Kibdelosporangium lantanae]